MDRIFARFYQVDTSNTKTRKGAGIGLSITKELVELHHGKINVESVLGKGSLFVLSLPLGKDHLNIEEIMEEDCEEKGTEINAVVDEMILEYDNSDRLNKNNNLLFQDDQPLLLIVEDNDDVRKFFKECLTKNYAILEAPNGSEGVKTAIKFIPDLVISDVMMPQMDGFQLCNKLKSDERTSHIPIILLTAKATTNDKFEGLEKGADAYIMKPCNINELRVRIRALIEQRKKIREHFINEGFFNCDEKNISSFDRSFLKKVVNVIENHLSNGDLSVEMLADELAISRSQLHRKLISLVGESPNKLMLRIRLDRAAKLLEQNYGNISEIALEVGFHSPAYFSKCFHNQFGKNPSEY